MQTEEVKKVIVFDVWVSKLMNRNDKESLNQINKLFNIIKIKLKQNPPPGVLGVVAVQKCIKNITSARLHNLQLNGFSVLTDAEGNPYYDDNGELNHDFKNYVMTPEQDWIEEMLVFIKRETEKFN